MRYTLAPNLEVIARHDPTVYTVIRMGEAEDLPYWEMLEKLVGVLAAEKQTLQALLAENAALREIVVVVAEVSNSQMHMARGDWAVCPFQCGAQDAGLHGWRKAHLNHREDCPVTKARALLGEEQNA
jgi:hypothetical protein